jgi:UDP-glucose 4-epimerase
VDFPNIVVALVVQPCVGYSVNGVLDNSEIKRVVITGAAGFIGGHLANQFLRSGCKEVVGIDSLRSGDWSRVDSGVDRIQKDLIDISITDWLSLLDHQTVVFHLAAEKYNSSKSSPSRLIASNVTATEQLFRATAAAQVRRVVFTSSLYVYGTTGPNPMCEVDLPVPNTLYGSSKLMGENMLRAIDHESGLSWNVARLFFVYGPRQFADGGYKSVVISNFERMIANRSPVIVGDGQQSLDYIYIDDCVHALIALASSSIDQQIVNVGSGKAVTIDELTVLMQKIAGFSDSPLRIPPDWTQGSARWSQIARISKNIGWEPKTQLEDGLQSVFDSLKLT